MDLSYALKCWAEYRQEIELVSNGGKGLFELGHAEKRKAEQPKYVVNNAGLYNSYELSSSSDIPEGSVAHLKMSGAMRLNGGLSSRGIRTLANDFRVAAANDGIKAVVFEVNSGGGEALAGQELKNAILDTERSGTPVYVYGHMVGSAALDGVLPASGIFAAGIDSLFGSIGSYVPVNKEILEYIKENNADIYPPESTQKNIEIRELLKGNEKPFQEFASKGAQRFQQEVIKYRQLNAELQADTLKGGMFAAEEAQNRGLNDGIKTFGEVLELAFNHSEKANSTDMNFNEFKNNLVTGLNRVFGWELNSDASEADILDAVKAQPSLDQFKAQIISEATAALNSQFKALQDTVNAQKQQIEDLQAKVAHQDSTDDVAQLKAELKTLKEEKQNLEQQVADLNNEAEKGPGKGGNTAPGGSDVFNDVQSASDDLTVANEVKYG